MADEPQERYELRKSLMILNWNLDADATQHRFDFQMLKKHNMHVQHMSLEKGSADNPRFFTPYANLPPVTPEILEAAEEDPPTFTPLGIKDNYSRWFHHLWHRYTYDGMRCDSSTLEKQDWPWVRGWYVHSSYSP